MPPSGTHLPRVVLFPLSFIGLYHPSLTGSENWVCETKGTAAGVHPGVPGVLGEHMHMHAGSIPSLPQQKGIKTDP